MAASEDVQVETIPVPEEVSVGGIFPVAPAYFQDVLPDAEGLLRFAAESGIAVDDTTRDAVLNARLAGDHNVPERTVAELLAAYGKLTALVKPVTAASLRASSQRTARFMHEYSIAAGILALIIVPFSVASFLASSISNLVKTDITTANGYAVRLQEQLGYPASPTQAPKSPCTPFPEAPLAETPSDVNKNDVIGELQDYAATIRSIDAHARQLDYLLLWSQRSTDPCRGKRENLAEAHAVFQLPAGIPNLAQAAMDRTTLYQDVRYFAQNLLDDISFYYGAITNCILPVLYALLGTCAYLLRDFERQMATRTFVGSRANSARFLLAGIGGAVVGLFNNAFITQGATIPPLALAFLVGYAVDVFFAFLEGMVKTLTKPAGGADGGAA